MVANKAALAKKLVIPQNMRVLASVIRSLFVENAANDGALKTRPGVAGFAASDSKDRR